jgi:alpha-galactosidase
MPPSMQYAYMSLWCLMASPLFYSGDMTKLDKFTLNILCNPEVIAVDQDELGECARVIYQPDSCFLMVKNLANGSKAVGLFNRGIKPVKVTARWNELKIKGAQTIHDLWREKRLGVYFNKYSAMVPARGVVMVKINK